MDVHVALPNSHRGVTLGQLTQITEVAEELGFNGVWPLDHVLVGPDLKDRYPWVIEPLTLLGHLAARTSRIRLGTSVIVLGMRNPFVVAKQAATLDLLSNGRFTLGLGAGYSEPEYPATLGREACGTRAASDWMKPSGSFGTSGPAHQDRSTGSSIGTTRATSVHHHRKAKGFPSSSAAHPMGPSCAQRPLATYGSRPG